MGKIFDIYKGWFGKKKDPLSNYNDYIKENYTYDDFIYETDKPDDNPDDPVNISQELLDFRVGRLNRFHKLLIDEFPTHTEDKRIIAIENYVKQENDLFTIEKRLDYLSEHLIRKAVYIYNKSLEEQSITRKEMLRNYNDSYNRDGDEEEERKIKEEEDDDDPDNRTTRKTLFVNPLNNRNLFSFRKGGKRRKTNRRRRRTNRRRKRKTNKRRKRKTNKR